MRRDPEPLPVMPLQGWHFIGRILCATDAFKLLQGKFGSDGSSLLYIHQPHWGFDDDDDADVFVINPVLDNEIEYKALSHTWNIVISQHHDPPLPVALQLAWESFGSMLSKVQTLHYDRCPLDIISRLHHMDSNAVWRAFWQTLHFRPQDSELMCMWIYPWLLNGNHRDGAAEQWSNCKKQLAEEVNQAGAGTPEWLENAYVHRMFDAMCIYVWYNRRRNIYQVLDST